MDNTFYHVNKIPKSPIPNYKFMNKEEPVTVGKEENQFIRDLKTHMPFNSINDSVFPKSAPLVEFMNCLEVGDCDHYEKLPQSLFYPLTHYMKLVGELILESVREKMFPKLPSRYKCLWLTDTQSEAEVWVPKCAPEEKYESQIVKVCARGEIFRCDASLLKFENEPLTELIRKSNLYWKGTQKNTVEEKEILFVGSIEVLEVLPRDKKRKANDQAQ